MTAPRRRAVAARLWALAIVLAPVLTALGCASWQTPQTTLDPQSDYAGLIQDVVVKLVFWVVLIFVVVEAVLIVTVLRFRSRAGSRPPRQTRGHGGLEIGWTVAPALILVAIAIPTIATIFKTQAQSPASALQVKVIAHRWLWEFRYPTQHVTTANVMHVPVGRAVALSLESADVIHSFWVPAVGGTRDVVPSRAHQTWFTPRTPGTFPGQCAEFCGVSHTNMRMKLIVESRAEFEAWVRLQQALPVEPDSATAAGRGRQLFLTMGCAGCHTIRGVAPGVLGPNLTHLASRTSIAGATYPNNPEMLAKWLEDPPARKPGALMPKRELGARQIAELDVARPERIAAARTDVSVLTKNLKPSR